MTDGLAQKRPEKQPKDGQIQGPKRPKIKEPVTNPDKGISQVKIVRVRVETMIAVPPNKGFLSLYTTPEASVTLSRGRNKIELKADEKGIVSFQDLTPGEYRIQIERDDFQSLTDTIRVSKGKQTALKGELVSRYGSIRLGLGELADSSVSVQMDGATVPPSQLKIEKGMISVLRVPVGQHSLRISRENFEDQVIERHQVGPGEQNDPLVFDLKPITITLKVKTLPNAQIYLDGILKGRSDSEGIASMPDLLPGAKKLLVTLEGYESVEREVTFSREQRQAGYDIILNPITEDAEFSESFDPAIDNWGPTRPAEWELVAGKGLRIRGDRIAFCKNTSRPNRPYNYYYDFDLIFNVSLTSGKGAAWVARAKDERNYYLFELTNSCSLPGKQCLNFYVYRDGERKLVRSDPVEAPINRPGDSFRIFLEARGNRFSHWIESFNQPGRRRLGGVFEDNTFAYGGIGFCACDGLEMFVNQVLVRPSKQ